MSLATKIAVPSGNCCTAMLAPVAESTTLSAGMSARTMSVRGCGSGLKTMRFFSPVRVMTLARRSAGVGEDLLLIAGGLGDHLAVFFEFGLVPSHVAVVAEGCLWRWCAPSIAAADDSLGKVDPLVAAAGQRLGATLASVSVAGKARSSRRAWPWRGRRRSPGPTTGYSHRRRRS